MLIPRTALDYFSATLLAIMCHVPVCRAAPVSLSWAICYIPLTRETLSIWSVGRPGVARHPQRHRLLLPHLPLQLVADLPADLLRAQLRGGGPALLPAREPQVPTDPGPPRPGPGDLPAHLRHQHGQSARAVPGE